MFVGWRGEWFWLVYTSREVDVDLATTSSRCVQLQVLCGLVFDEAAKRLGEVLRFLWRL
jgi:hypothetical protein